MTQKTEGYIELEWTCPNCQSNNRGTIKTCQSCGSPQPADVKFHLPGEAVLRTDQASAAKAEAGPDIHCPFCGARNAAGTKNCTQCGGDLSGGTARQSGQVVGAYSTVPAGQVACSSCGHLNAPSAQQCAKCGSPLVRPIETPATAAPVKSGISPLILIILVVVGCGLFFLLSTLFKTESLTGTVQQVSWSRVIYIEALQNVSSQGWKSDIPSNASLGSCTKKFHHTQDQPAAVATEVCGTPYVVDKGSGMGVVVKDCTYQVYEDYCQYTVQEWRPVDQIVLQGSDLNPRWPSTPSLPTGQRLGSQQEQYSVVFSTDKGLLTFKTTDSTIFQQCQINSSWNLVVNISNDIVSISPAR